MAKDKKSTATAEGGVDLSTLSKEEILELLASEREKSNGLQQVVSEQATTISSLEKSASKSVKEFENAGKKYQVVIPKFRLKKVDYTEDDVLESTELQELLIKQKSGVIVEIEAPEVTE